MNLQNAIYKRHSTREYQSKTVSKTILKKLIQNAAKAPSAKNEQPWNFYITTSPKTREKIMIEIRKTVEKMQKEFQTLSPKLEKIANAFYQNFGSAPHIILVYRNKKKNEPKWQKPSDYMGIAAAIENLMLSATSYELGTCWVGTFHGIKNQLRKILKVPNSQEYVTGLILGYPTKEFKPLKRKKKKLNKIMKFI